MKASGGPSPSGALEKMENAVLTINRHMLPQFDLVQISEDTIRTRGNKYKLIQHHCYYDLRKFNFTNRVIPVWN